MAKNLYNLFERISGTLPEALNTFRAQTPKGFVATSERLLADAVDHLESQGNYLRNSYEDTITSSVIGFFNRYGIRASSQTNSRGHVDIFIKHSFLPGLEVCGEAKIWKGAGYHVKGLGQVLGYCTGRTPYCFILEYVTEGNITDIVSKLRARLDGQLPEAQQGHANEHTSIKWALVTLHLHSSGKNMEVLHATANLSK